MSQITDNFTICSAPCSRGRRQSYAPLTALRLRKGQWCRKRFHIMTSPLAKCVFVHLAFGQNDHTFSSWHFYPIWRLVCQKQVSRAGTSNYIPQHLWDVITCLCPWYLLLEHQSWYMLCPASTSMPSSSSVKKSIHYIWCAFRWLFCTSEMHIFAFLPLLLISDGCFSHCCPYNLFSQVARLPLPLHIFTLSLTFFF